MRSHGIGCYRSLKSSSRATGRRRSHSGETGQGAYRTILGELRPPVRHGDHKTLRENLQTEVGPSVQTDSEQKRRVFLYGLLASLVKQRPLLVVKQGKMSNGYEAYRELIQSCEPLNKNRAMSLLPITMNRPAFNSKASLLSQVLRLETACAEY